MPPVEISDNNVVCEVGNYTLNNLEAIVNGDPRLNCPKTIVADYQLGGAPSLVFTKSVDGRIVVMVFFFFFVIRHSFTIEDLVSAPNLKLGCAVILRGCASDYK